MNCDITRDSKRIGICSQQYVTLVYNLGFFSGLSTEIFEKIVSNGDLTVNPEQDACKTRVITPVLRISHL
jgi:hypothetical protein